MTIRAFSQLVSVAAAAVCLGSAADARAGEVVDVEAKLIWATNHDKPPDESYKRADAKLSEDLQRAFKWKNYFIINAQDVAVEKDKKSELKMSDLCRLKIKYLGDEKFEVWIWGTDPKTGKETPLAKGIQKMGVDQKVLLMGVNDDESGWVVKLCRPMK